MINLGGTGSAPMPPVPTTRHEACGFSAVGTWEADKDEDISPLQGCGRRPCQLAVSRLRSRQLPHHHGCLGWSNPKL